MNLRKIFPKSLLGAYRERIAILLSILSFLCVVWLRPAYPNPYADFGDFAPIFEESDKWLKDWLKQGNDNFFSVIPDNRAYNPSFTKVFPEIDKEIKPGTFFPTRVITPDDINLDTGAIGPGTVIPRESANLVPNIYQTDSTLTSNVGSQIDLSAAQNQMATMVEGLRQYLGQALPILTIADIPLGAIEGKGVLAVSGGTRDDEFLPVSCSGSCAQIEMGPPLIGRSWMTGDQTVQGGRGWLKWVNNGQEPTGIKPWPAQVPVKLVIQEVDEAQGLIRFAWYLQIRMKWFGKEMATPHFIGPFPGGVIREGGLILSALNAPPVPSMDNIAEIAGLLGNFLGSLPTSGLEANQFDSCDSYRGVNLGTLALSVNDQPYDQVLQTTTGQIMGLGRYNFDPRNRILDSAITRPGGINWLRQIRQGYQPTSEEVSHYLLPSLQNYLINQTLVEEIAAAAGDGAIGTDLITIAVQRMATGVDNILSFDGASNAYAAQVLERYRTNLPKVDNVCQALLRS